MKRVLLYLWQLPQHLLGLLLIKVLGATQYYYQKGNYCIEFWMYEPNNRFSQFISGVSLGEYIILPQGSDKEIIILHEHGHSIQSMYFGLLYLLIIGIPSIVFNNLWDRFFHKKWSVEKRDKWYYNRFPEKQADCLGMVERLKRA